MLFQIKINYLPKVYSVKSIFNQVKYKKKRYCFDDGYGRLAILLVKCIN